MASSKRVYVHRNKNVDNTEKSSTRKQHHENLKSSMVCCKPLILFGSYRYGDRFLSLRNPLTADSSICSVMIPAMLKSLRDALYASSS